MIRKNWHILLSLLAIGCWMGLGFGSGCSGTKEKAECQTTLDCDTKPNHACVDGKCVKRGDEGEACVVDKEPGCVDGLICSKDVCSKKCTTDFDCDKGESCDTNSGACNKAGPKDSGPPTDEGPGQQIGEGCNPQKCATGLDCIKWTDNASKCWKSCSKAADCKDGRWCAGGYCVKGGEACQYDKPGGKLTIPCYQGLECVLSAPVEGTCQLACTKDDECPTGQKCVEQTGGKKVCAASGDKAKEGEPCGTIGGKQVDCVDGFGCVEKGLGSTDKICTKKCTKAEDCKWPTFCQSEFCVSGNVGTAKLGADCSPKSDATEAEKCEAGHYCQVAQPNDTKGKCYRDCSDARADACPAGTDCVGISAQLKICMKKCAKPEDCAEPTPTCGKLQSGDQVCIHKSP